MSNTSFWIAASAYVLGVSAANATMPELSQKPSQTTFAACEVWAKHQSPDAIEMWGAKEDGTSSADLGLSRLVGECMGEPMPDVVSAGSSAGMHEEYCRKHTTVRMCVPREIDRVCDVVDPTPTPLNLRSGPNGHVVGSLPNHAKVRVLQLVTDGRNRTWAFVVNASGASLGWVFREFLDCP